jgi:hypothetical protein
MMLGKDIVINSNVVMVGLITRYNFIISSFEDRSDFMIWVASNMNLSRISEVDDGEA